MRSSGRSWPSRAFSRPSPLPADIATAVLGAIVCGLIIRVDYAALGPLLVVCGSLAFRRVSPGFALVIAWVGALLQMALHQQPSFYDFAVSGVEYATAAYGSRRVRWLGLSSALAGSVLACLYLAYLYDRFGGTGIGLYSGHLYEQISPTVALLVFGFILAVLLIPWAFGMLRRAGLANQQTRLREEAAITERELAEYRLVVEQERNRIARDMHDVVAHSLAVVIAQADGARFVASSRPESAPLALETIAGVARGALGEVRQLLAELRHDEGSTPQPRLDELPTLYEQLRSAGLPLDVVEHGGGVDLGAGHELAAYRIVQEALTNALRHGDASAPVSLTLEWRQTGLGLEVVNTSVGEVAEAGREPGHGIPGMRERAQLAGGTFLAGPLADGRFRVSAFIPTAATS